ncbi:MAG: hypothetical protein E7623_04670 [Ruminococcaceae bacterium]|nr:hypothetical protein [Oscillospiraceae bacterium]
MNTKDGKEVPMGLGMALLSNPRAFINFVQLSADKQEQFINGTQNIKSKKEMDKYVSTLL